MDAHESTERVRNEGEANKGLLSIYLFCFKVQSDFKNKLLINFIIRRYQSHLPKEKAAENNRFSSLYLDFYSHLHKIGIYIYVQCQ